MRKLSESIWSDIQDRSGGETVRKEDDINLLDRDSLYDYLTSHYKNTNSFEPIYNSDTYDTIKVPFLIQGGSDGVYLDFKENEVYIPYASPYKVKGLFSKLADEFSLKSDSKTGHTWYIISPKDGSKVTNTFYIYVIDFLIDNIPDSFEKGVKKIVNESIWSDIQDRSAGEIERKEDDVNLLDRDGFYKYIMEHYKTATEDVTGPYSIINSKKSDFISIPILENDNILYRVIIFNFGKEPYLTIPVKEPFWGSDLFVKIRDTFVLKKVDWTDLSPKFSVWPKGAIKKTELNKFFLEVIDFIIDNAEEPFELLLTRI